MSRIPGTYEEGDRVRLLHANRDEGTVVYDNRKDGGKYVWVHFDGDRDQLCTDPTMIISVEVGR